MKTKNIIITSLTVFILLLTIAIVLIRVYDIHFNFTTYHSVNDSDYTFSFKGSFGKVRAVKIEKNSKKLCTLPFNASPDIFDDSYSAKWRDINFDGEEDLAFINSKDDDGDIHYIAYIYDPSENEFVYTEALSDLPNFTVDHENKSIYTSYKSKTYIEDPTPNSPEKYEQKTAIGKFELVNGNIINTAERAITFYSENDICCFSIYEYNEKYGKLTYVDEKWFSLDNVDKYPLSWD